MPRYVPCRHRSGHAGKLCERCQAGQGRRAHLHQTRRDEPAVVLNQRDDIGHGSQSGQRNQSWGDHGQEAKALSQRHHKHQREPGGAQRRGVLPVSLGLHDDGRRSLHRGGVMVQHDHVDSKLPGARHRVRRGDPAVRGDEKPGPVRGEGLDRALAEPIAVAKAVREVPERRSPNRSDPAEPPKEDGRGRDAVDVVVTMNRDPVARRDRLRNPLDGRPHPAQRLGIGQVRETRVQKPFRFLERPHAAATQQLRRDRMHPERGGEIRGFAVRRRDHPRSRTHHNVIISLGGKSRRGSVPGVTVARARRRLWGSQQAIENASTWACRPQRRRAEGRSNHGEDRSHTLQNSPLKA